MQKSEQLDRMMNQARFYPYTKIGKSLADDSLCAPTTIVQPKVKLEEPQLLQVKPRLEEPPKVTKEKSPHQEPEGLPLSARTFLTKNRASLTAFEYDEL